MVANANTVGGSAGNMTKTLELAGYTMVDPVNASGPNITESIVYYDESQAAAQAVADSVAFDLGGVDVLVLPTPAPTESGDIGDAGVLVLLGDDQAGKTLEELSGTSADGDEDVAAAPDPSDGDVPATAPADADLGTDDRPTTTDTTATTDTDRDHRHHRHHRRLNAANRRVRVRSIEARLHEGARRTLDELLRLRECRLQSEQIGQHRCVAESGRRPEDLGIRVTDDGHHRDAGVTAQPDDATDHLAVEARRRRGALRP